jgi:hypothetical protein
MKLASFANRARKQLATESIEDTEQIEPQMNADERR